MCRRDIAIPVLGHALHQVAFRGDPSSSFIAPVQAVQELPSIKEEEVPSEQRSNGNEGVKREADETEDAQAVLKRIKVEPA